MREFSGQDPGESTSYFVVQDEVLYRVFVPKGKDKIFQIVVPQKFRTDVMKMAHDIPLAGHLGNHKTRNRIMQHFYWPGIFKDVSRYCKSCPDCQKGTAKGRIHKVPLVSVPTIEEPFKRVAIDFVGPLPLTDAKNRYILVCVN